MNRENTKRINMFQSQNKKAKILFKVNESNGDIQIECAELLTHLLLNSKKFLISLAIVGDTGSGKSSILNLIATQFTKKPYMLFQSCSKIGERTIGIQYFVTSLDNDTEILFFDCEGFENMNKDFYEDYNQQLLKLVAQICRISTFTIHVSTDTRLKPSFINFLRAVDIENRRSQDSEYFKKRGILSNFIEILNKQSSYQFTKNEEYPIFERSFYIQQVTNIGTSEVQIDMNSFNFIKEISQMIKNEKIGLPNEDFQSFQSNITCKKFYDILMTKFDIIRRTSNSQRNLIDLMKIQQYQQIYFQKMFKNELREYKNEIHEIFKTIQTENYLNFYQIQIIMKSKQKQIFNKISNLKTNLEQYIEQELQQIYQMLGTSQDNFIISLIYQDAYVERIEIQNDQNLIKGYFSNDKILEQIKNFFQQLFEDFISILPFNQSPIKQIKSKLKKQLQTLLSNSDTEKEDFKNYLKSISTTDYWQNWLSNHAFIEDDSIIPFLYFSLSSKIIKKKNLERIYGDKKVIFVFQKIVRSIKEKENLSMTKEIISYINQSIEKNEKKTFKNKKLEEVFDDEKFNFIDPKYNKIVSYTLDIKLRQNEQLNQDFKNVTSGLLLLFLGYTDLYNQLMFEIIYPLKKYDYNKFVDLNSIKKYLKFQQQFLQTYKNSNKKDQTQQQLTY